MEVHIKPDFKAAPATVAKFENYYYSVVDSSWIAMASTGLASLGLLGANFLGIDSMLVSHFN